MQILALEFDSFCLKYCGSKRCISELLEKLLDYHKPM